MSQVRIVGGHRPLLQWFERANSVVLAVGNVERVTEQEDRMRTRELALKGISVGTIAALAGAHDA